MSKAVKKSTQVIIIALFISVLVLGSIILAPGVGAASESAKTETEIYTLNNDTQDAETDELTARAITIDEAKKQAQAAVKEQLSIIAQQEEEETESETETEAETTVDTEETQIESEQPDTTSSSSSTEDNSAQTASDTTVVAAASTGYLVGIDNPDPNYVSYAISLSDSDRDMAERIIMGEAGSTGFTGMALVAQCLRDAYATGSYASISDLIRRNGYYGSTSITPSSTCKEVVNYIFDQGGAAVQHRILVFYASNYCSSAWHESQNFITSYGYVRFFDMW